MSRYIKLNENEANILLELFDLAEEEVGRLLKKQSNLKNKILRLLRSINSPIKISSRKAKGREFQKLICSKIASALGIEYNQQDDNCLIHSREMGQKGVDVILRGEAFVHFPYFVECKNTETIKLVEFIKQAKVNCLENFSSNWILFIKNKLIDDIVVLDTDIFFSIIRSLIFYKKSILNGVMGKNKSKNKTIISKDRRDIIDEYF